MKPRVLATMIALGINILLPIQAQQSTQAVITKGESAKFYIIEAAAGIRSVGLSPDGRFVGGSVVEADGYGFIYDIDKDSTWISQEATFIISPDWHTGGANIYKDGDTIPVETRYAGASGGEFSKSSIWAASADLTKLFTMSYEEVVDPFDREIRNVNFAYLVDGTTGKIIERIEPHWPMRTNDANRSYGERVNGASGDGTVIAGHSSKPGVGTNWSPVFWDLEKDTSFFAGTEEQIGGSLSCVNKTGSLIGGSARGKNVIIHYDREHLSFSMEEVPGAPGMSSGGITDITETDMVLLYQAISSSSADRTSYLYDLKRKELIKIEDYLKELYGLSLPIPSGTALNISDNGRMICGWSIRNGAFVPYLIAMDENQIFAKARNFSAEQYAGQMTVEFQWTAPMAGQYTLKGYNIYCDSVQVNAELIDKDKTEFLQNEGLVAGVHSYAIQAVYEEGVSAFSDPYKILIVDENGCFPVQQIGHTLTYNRQVEVYWGLPSSQMGTKKSTDYVWDGTLRAPVCGEKTDGRPVLPAKAYRNENLDLIDYKAFETYSFSSAFISGNRLYASKYRSSAINVYNLNDMNVIESYIVEGVSAIRNMVSLNGKIYLTTGEKEILILDMNTMTISNRLKTEFEAGHLCYIPELNDGKGGFAYGEWSSLHYCNMYGQTITPETEIDITGLSISGSAYYHGMLYLFSQSGENLDELYTVDFATGKFLSKKALSNHKQLQEISSYGFIAGGLSLNVLSDSTIALGAMLQFEATVSHIAFLEIESSPKLLGYNLYRNGEKINAEGEYIQGLSFSESLFEPGSYTYTVEAVSKDNCTAMLDDVKTTVTILPIGECTAPSNLIIVESNKAAVLTWDFTGTEGPALVGFNLYRNGEQIADNLLDLKYTDYNLAKGDYLYRVEAFHDNSCVASDSVQLNVTHEGTRMPPVSLTLSATSKDDGFDVQASWNLPYFETPLAIGYSNLPYSGTGLASGEPMYVAIGWDSAGLDAYRDLYVVGIEYFIGEQIMDLEGLVYLNDTLAYTCPSSSRITENGWNTLLFDRYISMDQPMEVVVGYKVTYADKTLPVAAFDMGPAVTGYGDLLSADGQQWSTLSASGLSANWCINALVVKKRDLEKVMAGFEPNTIPTTVKTMRLDKTDLSRPTVIQHVKATSESVKLQGFNVYRDDKKLNDVTLKEMSYTDASLPRGSYDYKVTAVYADGEEKESETILLDLTHVANQRPEGGKPFRIFPNPARSEFHIQGEFSSLDMINLTGSVVRHYEGETKTIRTEGLVPGVYMLRFTLENGSTAIEKIVLR